MYNDPQSITCFQSKCLQDAQRCEGLLLRHLERDAVLTSPHGILTQAALSALTQMACAAPRNVELATRCLPLLLGVSPQHSHCIGSE